MRKEFFRSSLFPEKSVERDRIRRLRQVHPWESAREKSAALKRSALLSQAPDAECKKRFVATTVIQKPVRGTFSARLHLSSLKQLSFGLDGCPDSWSSRKNRNNDRFRDEVQAMVIQQRDRTEALMMYLLKSWQVRSISEGQKKLLLFRWTSCATSLGSWLNMVFDKQGFKSDAASQKNKTAKHGKAATESNLSDMWTYQTKSYKTVWNARQKVICLSAKMSNDRQIFFSINLIRFKDHCIINGTEKA